MLKLSRKSKSGRIYKSLAIGLRLLFLLSFWHTAALGATLSHQMETQMATLWGDKAHAACHHLPQKSLPSHSHNDEGHDTQHHNDHGSEHNDREHHDGDHHAHHCHTGHYLFALSAAPELPKPSFFDLVSIGSPEPLASEYLSSLFKPPRI